ncbi:MAG: phage portal protein [Planctomycetota bacterium]
MLATATPAPPDRQATYAQAWGVGQRSYQQMQAFFHGAGPRGRSGPTRPYEQVVAVFRCINFIGDALSMMPFMQLAGDDRVIESGPLIDLAESPSPRKSGDDFWRESAGWLFLSRRLHWIARDLSAGRPMSLFPAPGELVKPVYAGGSLAASDGELVGWLYRPSGRRWEEAIPLEPEQVYTIKVPKFDVGNDLDGASTLDVVRGAVNQVFKADVANERSLDHDVQPGGAFVTPPAVKLTEPQRRHFKAEVGEKNAGYENRNRFMLLEGGVDFKKFQSTFAEMEFSDMLKLKFGDIAIGFGFDPAAIGMVEGGRYEFVKQAKQSAWIDRILPIADWLAGHWTRFVQRGYGSDRSLHMKDALRDAPTLASPAVRACHGYRRAIQRRVAGHGGPALSAFFDSSAVPAVREALLSRAKEGAILIDKYKATPEDVIDLFDIGLPINDAQRVSWQTTAEMPVDLSAPGGDDPSGSPAAEDPGVEPDDPEEQEPRETAGLLRREVSESQLEAIWTRWRASWRSIETSLRGRVRRHFVALRSEVLANLDRVAEQLVGETPEGESAQAPEPYRLDWVVWDEEMIPHQRSGVFQITPTQRSLIGEILFDLKAANDKLVVLARPMLRSATRLGGDQAVAEHEDLSGQDTDPFNLQAPDVASVLRRREIQVTDINRTVRRRLAATMADAIEKNQSATEIGDRIRREFNLANTRATTIARTEIGRSVEEGRAMGRTQAGTPLKSWLWSRKETRRPWHFETETQTFASPVANDQDFTVAETGNRCPHPRATNDAKDDINCGCTTVSRFPGDQIRAVVGYYAARGFAAPDALASRAAARHSSRKDDHDETR